MKNATFFVLLMLFLGFALSIEAQIPKTSTTGNDVWYFIQCLPRNPDMPNNKWLTGAANGGELTVAGFAKADNQRWKVIEMGTGFALVNKAYGTYMNTDQRWSGAVATSLLFANSVAPATAVKFVPSLLLVDGVNIVDVNTSVAADFTINAATMLFSFYSAGSGIFKPISYNAININSSVKFMQEKDFLKEAITTVRNALNNSSEGNNPGQFNSESITGMTEALDAAQLYYNDPTTTPNQFLQYADELLTVFEDFKSQIILPYISTATVSDWYFIQGTRPANTYITSTGPGGQVKDLPVIPDDTQLWKLVENPNGGFSMQNKVTGEFINTDVESGTAGVILSTQSFMPANGLRFITSTYSTNKTLRFWIENIVGSTPAVRFHAGGTGHSNSLMNWTGNKDDNCTWLFMSYSETLKANLILTRVVARAFINAAKVGDKFGQYSQAVYDAYNAVITAAEALDVPELTDIQCLEESDKLKAAALAFTCNNDVKTVQSPTPESTDYWFRLVNAATADYARDKAMSSQGRAEGEKYTFEAINEASDAQLFRFELNNEGTAMKAIVNKANEKFMGPTGAIVAESVSGIEFVVEPLDGFSFKIVPTGYAPLHAQQSGSHIVNWNSGAGSASAWRFVFVKEEANVVLLNQARTVSVSSGQPLKGSAVITGTANSSVTTNVMKVSVTALPNKGVFFTAWTNTVGDTISKANPFIYTGESNIELVAHFVDGYYKPMMRLYTSATPSVQQENRYLESAYVTVGEKTQTVFEKVTTNPNPIDPAITGGQIIGNAVVDGTAAKIEIPTATDYFSLRCVGRFSEGTVEDLRWTQQITFIDWNQDFDFVDDDEISTKSSEQSNNLSLVDPEGFTRIILIPNGLPEGYYRMRVIYHEPVSATDNWGKNIWTSYQIRNGVAYDFIIKYGTPSAVVNPVQTHFTARVLNSLIVVEGVDNYEIFNISGQKLRSDRALSTGVYFVKSGNEVQKVMVR